MRQMKEAAEDCKPPCNETRKPGPTTLVGRTKALANLVPGGRLEHGGWRFLRRGVLPQPWGPDAMAEAEEIASELLARCGGEERASLSALTRIDRIKDSFR